jgi:hypothetical protein
MQAEKDAEFVGAALDAGLRAARFSLPPSSEEFAASIEPKNVPAVTPLRLIFSKLSLPSFLSPFLLPSILHVFPCFCVGGNPII